LAELLTTKQVARAFGLSESTVKRWCDRGEIRVTKTTGGHRRLEVVSIIEFARTTGQAVVSPEMLGLPATIGQGERTIQRAANQLFQLLTDGDENGAKALLVDLHMAKIPLAKLIDQVVSPTFARIGQLWAQEELPVYVERRACEICLHAFRTLREMLPQPSADAPLALGGTLSGDHYSLPTAGVELVLRSLGWRAVSLGTNLPVETMLAAIERQTPRLFWISATHVPDLAQRRVDWVQLADFAAAKGVLLVGGGKAGSIVEPAEDLPNRLMASIPWLASMSALETLAASLMQGGASSDANRT
jgi:excisionase family DNA binding protein